MNAPRPVFWTLLAAHILVVWGGIGLLGEGWVMLIFTGSRHFAALTYLFLAFWLVSTLSPVVGIISLWRPKLQPWYVGAVALTLFVIWGYEFMREIGIFYYDPL